MFLCRGNPDILRDKVPSYWFFFSGLNLMSSRNRFFAGRNPKSVTTVMKIIIIKTIIITY